MNTTRTLRVVALGMVIAILAVFMMAFTVSAHTVSPYSIHALSCKGVPITNIATSKKTKLANYKPNKLSVKVSTTLSFCIDNKTKASQGVTIQGSTLVTIPAGQTVGILCNRPNTGVFSLVSNTKAKLTVVCK